MKMEQILNEMEEKASDFAVAFSEHVIKFIKNNKEWFVDENGKLDKNAVIQALQTEIKQWYEGYTEADLNEISLEAD